MRKKTIALIQGGPGPESEVSRESAQAVAKAIARLGYKSFLAEADKNLPQLLIREKPDLAFLAVHGVCGEDGLIQSLCEFLKIPYTGSGVLASSLCMDKIFFKKLALKHKIPTPPFHIVDSIKDIPAGLSYPAVVKSSHGGSSLGTYIVRRKKDLLPAIERAKKAGAGVFIEEYIPNKKEIAVSLLDGKILTSVEIEPKGGFYDYKRKYTKGESSYFIPPRIDPFAAEKLKSIAESAFRAAHVRAYARADFLLQEGKIPWLVEINTLPGLTENSLLPKSARYDGISFNQLIQKIIGLANRDYKI